jgi:O-antigen/teichoic acid export membrane protein
MPFSKILPSFRQNFLKTFVNQILIFGVQFLGSLVIVQALSIPDYAAYILFNTTLNLATNLANMGLRSYMTRFVPGANRPKAARILWAVIGGQILSSLALLLLASPLLIYPPGELLGKFHQDGAGMLFFCFAGSLLLSFLPRQFSGYFRYLDEDHKSANNLQLVTAVSFPLFVIASFLVNGTLTLPYVLVGMVGCHLFSVATVLLLVRGRAKYPGTPAAASELRLAMAYSWPYALLPVAQQFIELGNRYFLAGFGTPVDLASFSFNYSVCNSAFTLINTSMGFTFFPAALRLFNEGKRKEGIALNLKGTLACAALVTLFFAVFLALSPAFFRLLNRETLRLAAWPLTLICISFLCQSLTQHGNFLLQAYNRRIGNVAIILTGAASSLVLNFLLIPRYPVVGAALALALTSFFILLLNLIPAAFSAKESRP